MATPTIEVISSASDHAFGRVGGALLYTWRGETLVSSADALGALVDAHHPLMLFGVVEPGSPPPSNDARKALAALLQRGNGSVRASAVTFEGTGFQASMVRAIATGLALVGRPAYPHQVFATVPEACSWLGDRLGDAAKPLTTSALAAAMTALRRTPATVQAANG